MRDGLWAGFLSLLLCFSLAGVDLHLSGRNAAATPPPPAAETPAETPAPPPGPDVPATLRVLDGETVREMDMQDYLIGVTAAEMPADFAPEALKAQAVAARTYAVYCRDSRRHPDADVCTDFGCCQAWCGDDELRRRWGADYAAQREKIAEAVAATDGELLCFEGQAIFAAFHSSSAGFTEDCGAVWSELPYLVSVMSPEDGDSVPGYVSTRVFSPLDFRDTLLSAAPDADFSGPPETWPGELTRDASGRVESAMLGGARFSGVRLRQLFSLRSTAFTLDWDGENFVFTVTGFGHGVGMSQYGANVLAGQGRDYREILAHYYPGTELVGAGQQKGSL